MTELPVRLKGAIPKNLSALPSRFLRQRIGKQFWPPLTLPVSPVVWGLSRPFVSVRTLHVQTDPLVRALLKAVDVEACGWRLLAPLWARPRTCGARRETEYKAACALSHHKYIIDRYV